MSGTVSVNDAGQRRLRMQSSFAFLAPEGYERFHAILQALPFWKPDKEIWELVIYYKTKGDLDLEEQANLLVTWLRANPRKSRSRNTFIVNWLRKAVEYKEQRNGREAGTYLRRLTDDDLRERGNIVSSDTGD